MSKNQQRWQRVLAHYAHYRAQAGKSGATPYMEAVVALERLARHAKSHGLGTSLFPWTSMNALCLQQVDAAPYSCPYLSLTPLADGSIEVRYVDTAIEQRQWRRIESPETVLARLDHVIDQLHWRVEVRSA